MNGVRLLVSTGEQLEAWSRLVALLDGIRLQWFYSGRTLDLETSVERYFDLLVGRLSA